MRYASRSVARNTGCSWPERTRLGTPGRWRAVDESGAVLDVLLQARRDAYAAQTFFEQLLITYDVPDVIHTDKLRSYGAAIRELPVLHGVEHTQVISAARRNNLTKQRAGPIREEWRPHGEEWRGQPRPFMTTVRSRRGVPFCPRQSHRPTRKQERSGQASSWGGVALYRCCSRRQSVLPKKSARVQETATGTRISGPACSRFEPPPAHPYHCPRAQSKEKSVEGPPGLA